MTRFPIVSAVLAGLLSALALPCTAAPQSAPPAVSPATEPLPEIGSRVPPAFRADTYHRAATEFLEGLPETTRVRVERASGANFELNLEGGRFVGRLPPSTLSEDGTTVTTPLGFRLSPSVSGTIGMTITAPNGRFSTFTRRSRRVIMYEGDGYRWSSPKHNQPMRLPDATRLDMFDEVHAWEILTLLGERYRYDARARMWTVLGRIPSPPLIPDLEVVYLAGNGDDWRLPFPEDHTVFAWSWYPYGFTIENVLTESWRGFRRADVEEFFKVIEVMPAPTELGAYMLARRLALGGGDRLIIELPGQEPVTVYLLPGPIEPNFFLPRVRDVDLVYGNRSIDDQNRK